MKSTALCIILLLIALASGAPTIENSSRVPEVVSVSRGDDESAAEETSAPNPVAASSSTSSGSSSGHKCLSFDGSDPTAWDIETIEEYCTRPMLKCQCDLAQNSVDSSSKAMLSMGGADKTVNVKRSEREEGDSIVGWQQMCEFNWIKNTVCDDETKDCAMELYGRFVFGHGVGTTETHESWWSICKKKLQAEGEVSSSGDGM